MAQYIVKYTDAHGPQEIEIEADTLKQGGQLVVEFHKYAQDGSASLVAAFEKGKFISAIKKE